MDRDKIVAIALLSQRDLDIWGGTLRSVYPVTDAKEFDILLREIDAAARDGGPGRKPRTK